MFNFPSWLVEGKGQRDPLKIIFIIHMSVHACTFHFHITVFFFLHLSFHRLCIIKCNNAPRYLHISFERKGITFFSFWELWLLPALPRGPADRMDLPLSSPHISVGSLVDTTLQPESYLESCWSCQVYPTLCPRRHLDCLWHPTSALPWRIRHHTMDAPCGDRE